MTGTKLKIISIVALLLVVLLWGIAPVVSDYLFNNNYYSPALLVAVRGLLGALTLLIVILLTKGFKDVTKAYWICIPAGIFLGAAYLFQFIGLADANTTPAKNTFLESISCIAVPITMFILVREKPTWSAIFAAIACLIGSFVLCGNGWDFSAMFTTPTMGDIFSAIGGVFFGIDIAFTKVFARGKNPVVYVFFQLVILTIMSFAYAIPFEKGLAFSWSFPNIMILVFLGVGCTAFCWLMRTDAIKNVSAVTCAVIMPMAAVIATITSILFKLEEFSWNVVVGGLIITLAIVISGVYDAEAEKRHKKEEEKKLEEVTDNGENQSQQ